MTFIHHTDALDLLENYLPSEKKVHLFCIDPPFYGIVKDSWDNQWKTVHDYLSFMGHVFSAMRDLASKRGSLICFQGVGMPGEVVWPIDGLRHVAARSGWHYRNWITWGKRRGYGKSHDYLFCREEIFWFSASPQRTKVTFNIPLTDQVRGYDGWNKKYPAKSKFKRVTNVWSDIPELMRPQRNCQKPVPLMDRLIKTHSKKGDLVVDCFAGWGTTGISAVGLGRKFVGCEGIREDAIAADQRVCDAFRAACGT